MSLINVIRHATNADASKADACGRGSVTRRVGETAGLSEEWCECVPEILIRGRKSQTVAKQKARKNHMCGTKAGRRVVVLCETLRNGRWQAYRRVKIQRDRRLMHG